jgi:cation-transporting ATPase I
VTTTTGAPRWRGLRELPFEPGRGFHAVLGHTRGRYLISVKGAPEVVLPRCVVWRRRGAPIPLTDADRTEIHSEVDRLARHGWRVLAVAERAASRRRSLDEDRVDRLDFLGLLALADPVRPAAAEALTDLRRAGVDVVMLTGDHPSTAESIAAELGILDTHGVVTGPELDGADQAQIDARIAEASVFARVTPTHKVRIVAALRRAGRVVAVTGDGANDAPAIRLADVGIALGDRGTTAAREAADVVVMDDRVETIVHAVIEGRALWMAVRDAVALLLGGNLGEIAFTVGSSLLSTRPPLNARQLLLINLITDLLPAITIAARRPRHVTPESLLIEGPDASLGPALTRDIIRRAVATTTAAYGGWLVARLTGTRARAGTVALGALAYTQLAQTALASGLDPLVLAAAALSAVALAFAVQTPVVSGFFGSRPLGPVAWSIVFGAAISGAVLGAAIRQFR